MFKNFNYQHLLIGIIFVFIVFIFLSRENFDGWNQIGRPTQPNISLAKQISPNKLPPTLTSANKICPSNSSLKIDICEYFPSIPRPRWLWGWGPCPNNYTAVFDICRVNTPTTSPTLICNNGSVLINGMCQSCPNNKKPENGSCVQDCPFGTEKLLDGNCYSCDQGKLVGSKCYSCDNNKHLLDNSICI